MKTLFSNDSPFFVGANYWASHAGTFMWRNWDASVVERDFRILHENGMQVLRVFPLWSDFQNLTDHLECTGRHSEFRYGEEPLGDSMTGRAAVDPEMLDRFHQFCQLARKYELKLIVGLLTGWMSGRLYAPPALEHRNLINDPEALKWEILFVRCFVHEMKEETAIVAWDWGNECNCLAPHTDTEMWVWGHAITSTIKLEDNSRPVISGLHNAASAFTAAMGEVSDILTTHPYPLFTPHCNVDFIDSFRSAFHAACQTCWVADIGKKPAFVEEIGSFGPTITSHRISALYARNALWNSYAHNCHGFLWWCANDQMELPQTPYDWNSMERELGLLKTDGTPKETLKEIGSFGAMAAGHPLAPHRIDAVALQCDDGDHWGVAFTTFMLAKRAGFDLQFHDGNGTLPNSKVYLLPSVSGTRILSRHQYLELLNRVKAGAVLYLSSCYCGLQPFDGFGIEIESIARADRPGRILSEENHLDLTVARTYAIRTGECTARVLARDEEGRPVFTVAEYGKGKLIFLAQPLENALIDAPRAFQENAPDYAAVYRIIAQIAGIRRAVVCRDPMVTLTEHPASDGTLEVVAVNNSGTVREVELQVASGMEIIGRKDNRLSIEPHSGVILTLKTPQCL